MGVSKGISTPARLDGPGPYGPRGAALQYARSAAVIGDAGFCQRMPRKNRSSARARKRARRPKKAKPGAGARSNAAADARNVQRSLLSGSSPGAILERIIPGDPLGLEPRCRTYLREWAVLIDLERLFARTAARIAYHAFRENGTAGSEIIEDCLANAVEELLEQDREEIALGLGPMEVEDGLERARFLAETLGIEFADSLGACVAFNDLPPAVRRSYWERVVEGRSLERCVSMGLGRAEEIEANVRHALQTLSGYKDSGPGGPP